MPPWSAASTRCAAACCSASTRWSSSRPSRAGRSTSSAAASTSAKRQASRCSRREAARGPWLLGYGESSDAHHMSTPHPEGLGARLALQDALERAQLTPARHRLHQPARHGQPEERRSRSARRRRTVSGAHVRQLNEGLDRPRARRGGHRRSSDQLLALEHGLLPGTLELADARSGLRPADPPRQRRAARCATR